MHAHGVFHRDLKPENIMLSKDIDVLLGDLGGTMAEKKQEEGNQTGTFTKLWADDKARDGKFSVTSEIYALGLLAYFIMSYLPFIVKIIKRKKDIRII